MNRLILHHPYGGGLASDVTGHGNHGKVESVRATPPGALTFPGRVFVAPSDSLTGISPSFRLRIRFRLGVGNLDIPTAGDATLIYAPGSFALRATRGPDREDRIEAVIFRSLTDTRGHAIATDQNAVAWDQWSVVEFHHDGISRAAIVVDGNGPSFVEQAIPGPIPPPAAGLFIGNTPRGTHSPAFIGSIDDLKIWKHRPDELLDALLGPSCVDPEAIDNLVRELGAEPGMADWLKGFMDKVGAAVSADKSHAAGPSLQGYGANLIKAVRSRDADAFHAAVRQLSDDRADNATDSAAAQDLRDHLTHGPLGDALIAPILRGEKPDMDLYRRLVDMFCLEDIVPKEWPNPPDPESDNR